MNIRVLLISLAISLLWISAVPAQKEVLPHRKLTPHRLEIFMMSECPLSIEALDKMISAKRNGRLPEDFQITGHYIAQRVQPCKKCGEDEDELKFHSLHGQREVQEDIRQLCIQKYAADKFLDYLFVRGQDVQNADWQTPAKAAGIDVQALESCVLQEGALLLAEDIQQAEGLGITASPTFLYENRVLLKELRLLEELLGLEPPLSSLGNEIE